MPGSKKNPHPEKSPGKEPAYLLLPWSCKHYPDRSEIEAYISGCDWEVIAEIPASAGVDAELIANFIAHMANEYEKNPDLVGQLAASLESCLACDGKLTWEAEQEAQVILGRAKQYTRSFKSGSVKD